MLFLSFKMDAVSFHLLGNVSSLDVEIEILFETEP